MEGLERSSELSRVGTAVKHSRSCIWTRYSGLKLGSLQPALWTWSRAERIVFDSSVSLRPFTVMYSGPSEFLTSCPQRTGARHYNVCDAREART
jgi:hypothetical protein